MRGAGVGFQGGAAAVDTSTIVAGFVHTLTGSAVAVGAASAVLRFGWLFPQLFVAYLAQRRTRRMPFYIAGAFGRSVCLALLALLVAALGDAPAAVLAAAFFVLWTAYAFISGIVAVPYNDIVGRAIPSGRRSRLLAWRFFGGGILAIAVAAAAQRLLDAAAFPLAHGGVFGLGALLMFASATLFVSAGEPAAPTPDTPPPRFAAFLRKGWTVFRTDGRFRLFLYSQWLGGVALMALPFYAVQAIRGGLAFSEVPLLLMAQTVGALASNALWGHWGDRHGKQSLLEGVAILRMIPPLAALVIAASLDTADAGALPAFFVLFVGVGALSNGTTIAMLGYLMEISPDDRRPAYSGYFNVLVSLAALLPILGGVIAEAVSLSAVFAVAAAAAATQFLVVRRLRQAASETL